MNYVVMFEDDDNFAPMREQHMSEHLQFLQENVDAIQSAGPLLNAGTGEPAGGMWMVTADNADYVQQLIEKDPFWPTGLRKSVTVLVWNQVFANGERLR